MTEKSDEKITASFVVLNDKGLHARPSTELVRCVNRYNAQVSLKCRNQVGNGRSLLSILFLAAEKGTKIDIEATGVDAQAVVNELLELAKNRFNIKY